MAQKGLLLDIQLLENQFTKTEKKIATYVQKNPNQVLFMSITELADACEVADASVHRFCRTMGLKGYQEFKMRLSLSLSPEGDFEETESGADEDGSLQYLKDHLLLNHINVLKETNSLLEEGAVERTVSMMEEARRIFFLGIGDSMLVAKDARNKFLRITNKVYCVEDPHMQAMTAAMADEHDLLFFISYSGATKDNIYVAQIAKESGAKMVALTRFLKSPLTSYVESVLICGSKEGPFEGGSMGAKLSQLFIIEVLFQEFYRRNLGPSKRNKTKTSKAVVDKLY